MAQNFWSAIVAWTACFVATIVISLATTPLPESKLVGLVYSLTPRPEDEHPAWYRRPLALGLVVLLVALILNIVFW
jgi:SSS family solute:Na+ symporter